MDKMEIQAYITPSQIPDSSRQQPSRSLQKQATPLRAHRHKVICLSHVKPLAASACEYAHCATRFDAANSENHPRFLQRLPDLVAALRVPLSPHRQMITRRQPFSFLAITAAVRQDEVVAEIH